MKQENTSSGLNNICHLKPEKLWQVFDLFTQCPRPSRHEEVVLQAIESLCDEHELTHFRDEIGNLIITKPATAGFENRKGVIMQGHIDMVPQKSANSNHDFIHDTITTIIEDDWVTADGTTLGADNGIGVAAAIAVLISNDIKHGPLEVLITIDEETGMSGAYGLKPDSLHGSILLNLDTEDEGEIYVGCAGGVNVKAEIPITWQTVKNPNKKSAFELAIKGLRGGHSGLDIQQGRANANKLVNRFLIKLESSLAFEIYYFNGGTLRNAIARESNTRIIIDIHNVERLHSAVKEFVDEVRLEYHPVENDIQFELNAIETPNMVYSTQSKNAAFQSIEACLHGVSFMSSEFSGIVETSNNLACVKSDADSIKVLSLVRSLNDQSRDNLAHSIAATFKLSNAHTEISGAYPGWKPEPASEILSIMTDVYKAEFATAAQIKVIHAGLECGLFNKPYPHWDMISIGPTIRNAHSPDEKVHIPSVEKFWTFLLATLKAIPEHQT